MIYGNLKQHIDVKGEINLLDLLFIHPRLLLILAHVSHFCYKHNINFQITSIIRSLAENKKLKAVSKTHVQGRAFDFSIREDHGWTDKLLKTLVSELNLLFGNFGAISKSNGASRVIVIHDNGNGKHAHVQIRPGL